ncbi:MAG: UMP kinase [Bacilli bacterium]|nr:UMP kinase [Bacilli bacterium]
MIGVIYLELKYKRILIKLSGESLAGKIGHGIDFDRALEICSEIKEVCDLGVEVAIVVGGGNFWRGRSNMHMDRCTSDYIGMLGTTMNALALGDAFKQLGQDVRVQTGVEMRQIAEFYIKNRADRHLNKGRVVVFGCGTGSPFFSTDTAAALRSAEIGADAVLKATNVDGVYTADPRKDESATLIKDISYLEVLNKKLNVMDSTATTLCMDNDIPIIVFNINKKGNLIDLVNGKEVGTIVHNN